MKTARRIPTLVLADQADAGAMRALEAKGVTVEQALGIVPKLEVLRQHGVRSLLVEGGSILAGALLAAKAVDRLIIFQAPVILGRDAVGAFGGIAPQRALSAPRLRVVSRKAFGPDMMTVYAVSTE